MAISPERLAEMDFDPARDTFTATILSIGWGTEEDVELDQAMGEDHELRKAIAPVLSRLYALLCRFMRRYGSDSPEFWAKKPLQLTPLQSIKRLSTRI
ncbi:hypothetical protein KOI40_01115 [Aestuariicella sp. G3-2]|uniref:hypothetical protein n=1 Tax=Pseudomaricurvus albidus TaxID=2842452 RepID=UPI001C0D10A9|nr:hypothetical protein [Aestuariicella albida]MBU3068394.1 hypothetical protein [Aestuariicella albida]